MILSHQSTRTIRFALRAAGLLLRALLLVSVGTGLLYISTPLTGAGGPSISDALPLDELPGHSGSPILLFVLAWATAAWATSAIAPRARVALITTAAFWALQIMLDTASIGIVRQIHLVDALPAALSTPAPYLAAAIVLVVSSIEPNVARAETRTTN
jgi:hypothetical protein